MEATDDTARAGRPGDRAVLSRRRFLIIGGAGTAAAGLGAELRPALTAAAAEPTFTLDLVRREDMAVLTFEFHNLSLNTDGPAPILDRVDATQPAMVLVRLGSQHLMEQPTSAENGEPNPLPKLGERLSQAVAPSRIAFLVPQTVKSFPYTEEALFAWWQWVMQVHARALPPDAPIPGDLPAFADDAHPGELQTDLLLVDWLHLSPDGLATWLHPARPVTRDGRTELWHTVLRPRNEDGRPDPGGAPAAIRAVSTDPGVGTEFTVLRPGAQTSAPEQIVAATTHYELDPPGTEPGDRTVRPVTADLVLLSSSGASVELDGSWTVPSLSLAGWRHRSALGRDNYVRVVTRGHLFPFGHRAALITETERRIATDGVAHLFQRSFIVLREAVRSYADALGDGLGGRRFPFREIRLTTTVTPDLPPGPDRDFIPGSQQSFWVPTRNPTTQQVVDFPFPVVGTDWEGRRIPFSVPLAFVDENEARGGATLTGLIETYDDPTTLLGTADELTRRRTVALSGDPLAFAASGEPGDTSFPTSTIYLGAYPGTVSAEELQRADRPAFLPAVLAAQVRLAAVEALTGTPDPAFVTYDAAFIEPPTIRATADLTDLFLRVQPTLEDTTRLVEYQRGNRTEPPATSKTASFGQNADRVGGLAVPDLQIGALSRTSGPLSGSYEGISELATAGFDPQDFFPESATLLGDITLRDVLAKALPEVPAEPRVRRALGAPRGPHEATVEQTLPAPRCR